MIKADIHTHTSFSGDSDEPMINSVYSAIDKGLTHLCFTEHMDIDFPKRDPLEDNIFLLDTPKYQKGFESVKSKNKDNNLELLFGVELGLQPHLIKEHSEYLSEYPFDFVIGSVHTVQKRDPYYKEFYEGRSERAAYLEYFEDVYRNISAFDNIDALGHLDYVVRYGPNRNTDYSYSAYREIIDGILELLVKKDIALEINSAGFRYGLGSAHPCTEILKAYRQIGGELITVGSDAHKAIYIAEDFDRVEALLIDAGFKGSYIYKNRKPCFIEF